MLMVIFGAGASFDSSPTYPLGAAPPGASSEDHHNAFNRPPLAKELFANRPLFIEAIDHYPQCKTIVPMLRAHAITSGQRSIETLLQEIEEEAKTYPQGRQELAAVQCYLQRAISDCQRNWRVATRGITNYLSLLREIERTNTGGEPVCLVTFNYDTLLEDALQHFGYTFHQMTDYTERLEPFRLFKLHGSVDWGQIVENQLPADVSPQHPASVLTHLIDHAAELHVSNEFVLCGSSTMGVANGRPVFPAIAIPVEKKDQFACPRTFVEQLVQVLPQVSKILVVGWRATEDHFLRLMGNRHTGLRPGVQFCIVAGSKADAEETKVRIHRALLNNQPISSIDPNGFTNFLDSGSAKSFLG
jgi:SIR2-like protein